MATTGFFFFIQGTRRSPENPTGSVQCLHLTCAIFRSSCCPCFALGELLLCHLLAWPETLLRPDLQLPMLEQNSKHPLKNLPQIGLMLGARDPGLHAGSQSSQGQKKPISQEAQKRSGGIPLLLQPHHNTEHQRDSEPGTVLARCPG